MWPQAQTARGLLTPSHRPRTISGIFNIYIKYIRTNSRSHFNKSWQCPKNISIIKGATTKQKGQLNIGATGGAGASSAFGTFTQTDGPRSSRFMSATSYQANPPLPHKTTLIRIIWGRKSGRPCHIMCCRLRSAIKIQISHGAHKKCSLTVKATVPLNRYPVIGVG